MIELEVVHEVYEKMTAEHIISLYKKHNLKPASGRNYEPDDKTACLNGILAIEAGAAPDENHEIMDSACAAALTGNENAHTSDVPGFYRAQIGFDAGCRRFSNPSSGEKTGLARRAFDIGKAVFLHFYPNQGDAPKD